MIPYSISESLKNKFFQWLWVGKSAIPYRPQYVIKKVLSPVLFIISQEVGVEDCGLRMQLFWRSLACRFIYRYFIQFINKYYYYSYAWVGSWAGTRVLKAPTDLFVYQEILSENRPDVIIECGTANGGTALFLAHICDALGNGRIVTIDINPEPHPEVEPGIFRPYHDRILYMIGDTLSEDVLNILRNNIKKDESVMVILDSEHTKYQVKNELELYSRFVTPGQYLIVEDTNVGHSVEIKRKKDGPMDALREWLDVHPEFRIDYEREKHMLTFNSCGYLRRM